MCGTWKLVYLIYYCTAQPLLIFVVDAVIYITVSYSVECIFKTSLPISDVLLSISISHKYD